MRTAFLIFCIVISPVMGISKGKAATLDFESLLAAAVANAYDVKLAEIDIRISREQLIKARAEYYPTLSLGLANERIFDRDSEGKGVVSVGGSVISGSATTWQHSLAVNADYTLYDFGARGLQLENAERDIVIAGLRAAQKMKELQLRVLDLYRQALTFSKRLQNRTVILKYRQELYGMLSRLRAAGIIEELDLATGAIEVAETIKECDELRQAIGVMLTEITALTGEEYPDETHFAAFEEPGSSIPAIDVTTLPEIKAYDLEIRNKKAQYRIMETKFWPRFRLYSSYRFYGSDPENFRESLTSLEEKNITAGVLAELNLFNGFRDKADVGKLQAEVERLKIERQKAIAVSRQQVDALRHDAAAMNNRADLRHSIRSGIEQEAAMVDRLDGERLRRRINLLRQYIELEEKRLGIELEEVSRIATLRQLQFLGGAQDPPVAGM